MNSVQLPGRFLFRRRSLIFFRLQSIAFVFRLSKSLSPYRDKTSSTSLCFSSRVFCNREQVVSISFKEEWSSSSCVACRSIHVSNVPFSDRDASICFLLSTRFKTKRILVPLETSVHVVSLPNTVPILKSCFSVLGFVSSILFVLVPSFELKHL